MSEKQNPMYELIGNGLRVHFTALKSALIESSQVDEETKNRNYKKSNNPADSGPGSVRLRSTNKQSTNG